MMNKRQFFAIALMAFGIFFGVGNLIFPPAIAQLAGTSIWQAWLGFAITAVILPVLGIVTVAKTNGLFNLGKKVDSVFAYILTIGILIAIGPGLAIPRTGSTSFEMTVSPYLGTETSETLPLLIYTFIFFTLVVFVSWSPNKIVQRIGKITTPSLLLAIAIMFLITLFGSHNTLLEPSPAYQEHPILTGFLAGYSTLDTLAGLNYGLLVVTVIRSYQMPEDKIVPIAIKAGITAGIVLAAVYLCLITIGQAGANEVAIGANGAEILFAASQKTMGSIGSAVLGLIFVLACFNTCVGLVTSISQFFTQIIPAIHYHGYVLILAVWSFILANVGLNGILAYSVPVLELLYPIAITVIILTLTEPWLKHSRLTYRIISYTISIISLITALDTLSIKLPLLTLLVQSLPLTNIGLNWVLPMVILMIGCYLYQLFHNKSTTD